ncbi:aspartate/glutamate racemase family protein [Sciscionella marina]|uniref:aspartate/glutamate racemase family protein n=1 Tax=Sciscionella marina TaxID=508770 RepID=UPI0003728304|nr:amino acid racemase [Sciscionella marina]
MTVDHGELVGILGGMGPAASADFYARLTELTPAERDQDHLRVVIWSDPTVPDRVGAVLHGHPDPYPALLAGTRMLLDAGATVLAMPCHTAHHFLPRLRADTGAPFLDMVAETVDSIAGRGLGPVGLLSTRASRELYRTRFAAAGIEVRAAEDAVQQDIDLAIRRVKSGDRAGALLAGERAVRAMGDAGILVLACTELPIALRGSGNAARLLDPTELLARAVVRNCLR